MKNYEPASLNVRSSLEKWNAVEKPNEAKETSMQSWPRTISESVGFSTMFLLQLIMN